MKHTRTMITSVAALAFVASGPLHAEDVNQPAKVRQTEEQKSAVKAYPLDKCIVSDEKLGEMGEPFVFVYQGQEIKLCCKHCKQKFDKDPAKYLKKLERK